MPNQTDEYVKKVKESLITIFNKDVRKGRSSNIRTGVYSPRVDILVLPEAEEDGHNIYNKCKFLAEKGNAKKFVGEIFEKSMNLQGRKEWDQYNKNPRYFIGIEIENATARNFKHVLGSMTNLSALCFIGVVVFYESNTAVIERLKRYMSFVYEKKKIEIPLFPNVFILKRTDFDEIINHFNLDN
jgi:hypothetical protein